MNEDAAQVLWEEYAFFTKEMVKFYKKDDVNMFLALQEEQEEIYHQLRAIEDDDFIQTVAGQALKHDLVADMEFLKVQVRVWLNDAQAKQNIADAYSGLGQNRAGRLRDWNG